MSSLDPADLAPYMELAAVADRDLIASVLAKDGIGIDGGGTVLVPCTDLHGQVAGGSHWITWRPAGTPALLVQIKPARPRRRAGAPEPPPTTAPALFVVVLRGGAVHRLLADGSNFVKRAGPADAPVWTWPTTVLEGVLALREPVVPDTDEYDRARLRTLASLLEPAAVPPAGLVHRLVFLARECLWWRTPRSGVNDLQSRMVQARTLVEGDAAGVRAFQQPAAAVGGGPNNMLAVVYQPHMAPSQSPSIVQDVPRPLVGTRLAGIELRPTDPAAHGPLVVTATAGDPDAYGRAIRRLCSTGQAQ